MNVGLTANNTMFSHLLAGVRSKKASTPYQMCLLRTILLSHAVSPSYWR